MTQKTNPMQTGDAAALLKDPKRLKELLSAPETRRFMELLKRQNGSRLQSAAEAAKKGDSSALSDMLRQMSGSEEGAQAMAGLEKRLN